jgi:hypothetical protein
MPTRLWPKLLVMKGFAVTLLLLVSIAGMAQAQLTAPHAAAIAKKKVASTKTKTFRSDTELSKHAIRSRCQRSRDAMYDGVG